MDIRKTVTPQQRNPALISVILPTFNRGERVAAAIESVLNQSFGAWELLITDDGSTDDTCHILQQYSQADDRIRVETIQHQGVSAARNRSLSLAAGHVIAYLDSDNTWRDSYLESLWAQLGLTIRSSCYHAMQLHIQDKQGQEVTSRIHFNRFDRRKLLRRNQIDLNVFAHTRDLYEIHGGFDEQLTRLCDWDLIIRYTSGGPPEAIEQVGADYYHHASPERVSVANNFSLNAIRVALNAQQFALSRVVLVSPPEACKELSFFRDLGSEIVCIGKEDISDYPLVDSDILFWYWSEWDEKGDNLYKSAQRLDYRCMLSFYMLDDVAALNAHAFAESKIDELFHFFVAPTIEAKTELQQQIAEGNPNLTPNQHDRGFVRSDVGDYDQEFNHVLSLLAEQNYPENWQKLNVAVGIQKLSSEDSREWGDFSFAQGLCKAFAAKGISASLLCRDETLEKAGSADIFIYLFGINYPLLPPKANQLRCLWIISHVERLDIVQSAQFDMIFCASEKYTKELQTSCPNIRIEYLPQATDPTVFRPKCSVDSEYFLSFVGNSRGTSRPVVELAASSVNELAVWGMGWDAALNPETLQPGLLNPEQVNDVYNKSTIVLNDHWQDQLDWEIVNNRIFDVLACGRAVLSDANAGLERIFPELPVFKDGDDFESSLHAAIEFADQNDYRQTILNKHTFTHRVHQMLTRFGQMLDKHPVDNLSNYRRPRLCFLVGNMDASTTRKRALEVADVLDGHFEISVLEQKHFKLEFIAGSDIIILQRWTGRYGDKAQKLFDAIRSLRPFGKQFIYDIDDLILHLSNELPRQFVLACDAVTVSTVPLREQLIPWNSDVRQLPNSIDHRRYNNLQRRRSENVLQIIVISTDGAGFDSVCSLSKRLDGLLSKPYRFIFVTLDEGILSVPGVEVIHGLTIDELVQYLVDSDITLNIGEVTERLNEKLALNRHGITREDFLNCKSGIKFFYAALARTAFITTTTPVEYRNLVIDGKSGYFADDDRTRAERIALLASNDELRESIAANAYEFVMQEHTFRAAWPRYKRVFLELNASRLAANHNLIPTTQTPLPHNALPLLDKGLVIKQEYALQFAMNMAKAELVMRKDKYREKNHESLFRLNRMKSLDKQRESLEDQLVRVNESHLKLRHKINDQSRQINQLEKQNRDLDLPLVRFAVRVNKSLQYRLRKLFDRHME